MKRIKYPVIIAITLAATASNAQSWRSSAGVAVSHYTDRVIMDNDYWAYKNSIDNSVEAMERETDRLIAEMERDTARETVEATGYGTEYGDREYSPEIRKKVYDGMCANLSLEDKKRFHTCGY